MLLSLLQYAFTVILTSHRVDGSIESTRRRGAFDSIAPLRRVDCLYADSILLQIESIDCSYRLDRLDLEFIQRVSVSPVCTVVRESVACHWATGTTGLMQAMMELRSLRSTTGVPPAGFLSM